MISGRGRRATRTAHLIAALAIAVSSFAARAADVPPALPSIERVAAVESFDSELLALVAQLNDATYQRRERAMRTLLDERFDNLQLCALLSREDLSLEQRHRLLFVLCEQIVNTPRGALGISMRIGNLVNRRPGVEITDFVPGLPAERVLEVGDRITHINGRPIATQEDLIILVQTQRPGEEIHLTVDRPRRDERGDIVRDGDGAPTVETLNVSFELGSAAQLVDPRTGRSSAVNSAVAQHRRLEAQVARRRYGPQPHHLTVRGDVGGEDSIFLEVPPSDDVLEALMAIETIRQQRELILDGRMPVSPRLEAQWTDQLETLRRLAGLESIGATEREYLRRIAAQLSGWIDDL
jgi:hypothetical protein